jgi:hypothetical protein
MPFNFSLAPAAKLQCSRGDRVIFGAGNYQFSMLSRNSPKQSHLLAAFPAAESDRMLSGKTAIVHQFS